MTDTTPANTTEAAAVAGRLDQPVRPLGEPLFLLHCGALFGGERNEWDVEANSGRAVDELADQHPGETLHLYALTAEEVAAVNKLRARKEWMKRETHRCHCDRDDGERDGNAMEDGRA